LNPLTGGADAGHALVNHLAVDDLKAAIDLVCRPRSDARKPTRDLAVASLCQCLRFESAGDAGGLERSLLRWSQVWPRCC
jgi:hypothetical protein